jgi:hypothetical protein
MGAFRRFMRRLSESDEERLASTVAEWAASVPGTVRIAEAPMRTPVRLAAVVKRTSMIPGEAADTLEAVLSDGTGEITAVWLGRRGIPGMTLGKRLVVEGVLVQDQGAGGRKMVNPKFDFAA